MNDLYGAKAAIPENPATINLDPATGELTIPEVTPSIPPTPIYYQKQKVICNQVTRLLLINKRQAAGGEDGRGFHFLVLIFIARCFGFFRLIVL